MDPFQGITVEIVSNGQALDLYDDPHASEIEEGHSRHHYVEAVAGSTFEVKVSLTSGFNFYRLGAQHAVLMRVEIDSSLKKSTYCPMGELRKSFSQGQTDGHVFSGSTQFCNETGEWMLSDYSFGNLVLNENSDPGFSVDQAQTLGRIQVIVKRVKLGGKSKTILDTKPITTINEVPEKALKGRPIDTTVRLANARPTPTPSVKRMDYSNLEGEAGKPMIFNIYYRSRRALQMLGIIPQSPSPERQLHSDETTVPNDAVQKEVQDLRARLALLERGLNVKPESSSAATRNLKRERDQDERDERPRQRVKVEHVDLTDDRPRRRSSLKVEHVDLTDD